jgi:hypothetical protein
MVLLKVSTSEEAGAIGLLALYTQNTKLFAVLICDLCAKRNAQHTRVTRNAETENGDNFPSQNYCFPNEDKQRNRFNGFLKQHPVAVAEPPQNHYPRTTVPTYLSPYISSRDWRYH